MASSELPPKRDQDRRKGVDKGSPLKTATNAPTSSSSRPPPLHPILKNTRGPSSSGPRPTARFVSPPDSGAESGEDEEAASSGSTATLEMHPQLPPPAMTADKKATHTAKKLVAAASAHKRRPVLPRRLSSQSSSTPSDAGSRDGSSGPATKQVASQRPPPSLADHQLTKCSQGAELSAKAAGKLPAGLRSEKKAARDKPREKGCPERTVATRQQAAAGQDRPANGSSYSASPYVADCGRDRRKGATPVAITAQSMARSQSDTGQRSQPHQSSSGRQPPGGLAASSVAATSNVAVQGQFDFVHPGPAAASLEARDIPDNISIPSRQSSASLFTPTQPSPTPAAPLARSKSQLAVLLELDKDRNRHNGQNGSHKTEKKVEVAEEEDAPY